MDQATAAVLGAAVGAVGALLAGVGGAFIHKNSAREQQEGLRESASEERLRQRRGMARIVKSELSEAHARISHAPMPEPGQRSIPPVIATGAWANYAKDLCADLPLRVAEAVSTAYSALEIAAKGFGYEARFRLSEETLAQIESSPEGREELDRWSKGVEDERASVLAPLAKAIEELRPYIRDEDST